MESDIGKHQALFSQVIIDEAIARAHHVKSLKDRELAGESVDTAEIDEAIRVANQEAIEAARFIKLVGDPAEQLKQAVRLLSPEERWAD